MNVLVDGDPHKICSKCDMARSKTHFHKDKSSPDGLCYWCKPCANANSRKNHKRRMENLPEYREAKRASYIKSAHGISVREYEERLRAQGSICRICSTNLEPSGHLTHLDHCHVSGNLRDFLCTNCNRGLGHFQDNEELLMEAVEYLKKHKEVASSSEEGNRP